MKVLVAAACIAIIAFVGFFFWERYDERRRSSIEFRCAELFAATKADRELPFRHPDRQLIRDCVRMIETDER